MTVELHVRLIEATGEITEASLSLHRAIAVETLREMECPAENPLNRCPSCGTRTDSHRHGCPSYCLAVAS